jgi:hypothetical protein
MHLETEVRWHDEFAEVLAALPASPSAAGADHRQSARSSGKSHDRRARPANGADDLRDHETGPARRKRVDPAGWTL